MTNVGAATRPRATVFGAWRGGWSRVLGAPVMLFGLIALGALAALPFGLSGRENFDGSISIASWHLTFTVLRPALFIATCAAALFLSGGALDRLARGHRVGTAAFFAACGGHGARFARLAILLAPAYLALVAATAWFDLAAVFGLLVLTLIADVAQVRIVVEDRRSALAGIAAAWRFIRRRLARVAVLWTITVLSVLALVWASPQIFVAGNDVSLRQIAVWEAGWMAFVTVRLAGLASLVVFFQHELAHAGYVAAPVYVWPDSPAVEAIERLEADR